MEKIKVIITGSTGMIGESVLDQCLKHPFVEQVLIISRRPSGFQHPKIREVILPDLTDAPLVRKDLEGYDACFFCIGVSSTGMDEARYTQLTYMLTMDFAQLLAEIDPSMTFCYISGAGTDSMEKSRSMWARVKGRTEKDLMKLPFRKVYNFRPAALIPYLDIKPNQTYQSIRYYKWLLVLLRPFLPNAILHLSDFARAMINSVLLGYPKSILESKDIKKLSEKHTG